MKHIKQGMLLIALYSSMLFSIDTERLRHICAYSNESVVRFRKPILQKHAFDRHPGVMMDWPVDLCEFWISSLFGNRVNAAGVKKMHYGVDMAANKGTKVKAAADGIIKSVQMALPGYGNLIEIEHVNGLITRYAHLDTIGVKSGKKIQKGQIIGTVGFTGSVRGADPSHLHFEIVKDGKKVNPLKYLYWSERGYKKLKK